VYPSGKEKRRKIEMAIAFARVEFVKRADGRNACQKSAYIGRERIAFNGNVVLPAAVYDWTHKGRPSHHEVLLPQGTDPRYLNCQTLWNAAEAAENRKNSQVAVDVVLALPDDSSISLEDRIELARSFVKEQFIDKGLAVQLDIHAPEKTITQENGKAVVADHNWHAHVLATTRRFTKDGAGLGEKARDVMPKICRGKVVEGTDWGKAWGDHQNRFFRERGMSLRVDPTGVISQLHLGPVRMRGRAYSLLEEQGLRQELNGLESREPSKILEKLTENRSTFTSKEVDLFLGKFVPPTEIEWVREAFWSQVAIIPLLDPSTGKQTERFTSQRVWAEERRILRIADRLVQKVGWSVPQQSVASAREGLNEEQGAALGGVVGKGGLVCIDGHAGAGKSRVLSSLRQAYEEAGFQVRAFGADNATSQELESRGFVGAENIYRFLFAARYGHRDVRHGREIWLLDEAGKIGTQPLLELLRLAHKNHAKVVLAGSQAQMSSVARGSMFSELCQRIGSFTLEEIQRQRDRVQREMARSLATGEVGHALDQLEQLGGLRWSETKEEAMEDLITEWVNDRVAFPKDRALIIAHSNREVRTLNEMIHSFRRGQGELVEQEFECKTSRGNCWVSTGDLIEFRRNSKDLEVTNGMQGTLIEASSEKFVVGVRSDSGLRRVSFNPKEYSCFQLGYATTYYRSQGRTVDRAYVLHSRSMDRPMFYVGLTRHVRHAQCFLSRENIASLSDLRRQLYRLPRTNSTLPYTTAQEMEKEALQQQHEAYRQELLESDSAWDRLKGAGIGLLDSIRQASSHFVERVKDRRIDRSFYVLTEKRTCKSTASVDRVTVSDEEPKIKPRELVCQSVSEVQESTQLASDNIQSRRKIAWHTLTTAQQESLRAYFDASNQASSLWTLLQEGQGHHQQSFREACSERNEQAATVHSSFAEKDLRRVMSKKALEVLTDRAQRHCAKVEARTNAVAAVQERLVSQLEPLIHRLFPDGPSWKDHSTFRFGAKGSLAVRHSGPKAGSFYDFENQCGGGMLQLIQRERGMDRREALRWAKEFLGSDLSAPLPPALKVPTSSTTQDRGWCSCHPDPKAPAPSLERVSRKLNERFSETARYCYRDEAGSPLFYTLRLEERSDPSKKQVLPLSYGTWAGGDGSPRWAIKGFASTDRPLFNLALIASNPNAQVLVVEGEKTAEAASKLRFDRETICVSWCGGASAVSKTDWSPLRGREVIVWPDNDKAGMQAADTICSALRHAKVKSVKQVDPTLLEKTLPPKWDLADPLPEGLPERFVPDAILGAKPQSVNFESFASSLGKSEERYPEPLLREILAFVEDRVRRQLGETNSVGAADIQRAILKEARQAVIDGREVIASMANVAGNDRLLLENLMDKVILQRAKVGSCPSENQLQRMRREIQNTATPHMISSDGHKDHAQTTEPVRSQDVGRSTDDRMGREIER